MKIPVQESDRERVEQEVERVRWFLLRQVVEGVIDEEFLTMPRVEEGYLMYNPQELDTVWSLLRTLPDSFEEGILQSLDDEGRKVINFLRQEWGVEE